jgi:hypothetical protein
MRGGVFGVGLVMFAIGAGLLIVAANFARADQALAAKGGAAQGTVIDLVSHRNGGKQMFRPVVAFTDQAGRRRQFASTVSSNPPSYRRGEEVAVLYDPANPDAAMIDSFIDRHLGSLVFGILGTVFALFGGGVLVGLWRRR